MAQIFPQSANRLPLVVALAALVVPPAAVGGVWYYFSPRFTDVGYQPVQPVPYSHKLHAGEMQIDCRYCHASVERSAVANVPPTQACMNCHLLVARNSEKLAPIRDSLKNDTPMRWLRVHKLGEYAYFNHRAHVSAGVGCVSCHGHIEEMEVVHAGRAAQHGLVPRLPPEPDAEPAAALGDHEHDLEAGTRSRGARARQIASLRPVHPPTDCSGCHR